MPGARPGDELTKKDEEVGVPELVAKGAWRALGVVSAIAAGTVTRKVLDGTYKKLRGNDPPANPASPETEWGEALVWAALTGVAIAVVRMATARGAAGVWQKATGSLPPGLEDKTA